MNQSERASTKITFLSFARHESAMIDNVYFSESKAL
jgi:hypothetical protein